MLSIPSPNWESRQGETVRLVVVHTAETTADAVRLATYFSTTGANTSAHVCVDDTQMVQCVSYDHAAWTVRSGNHVSDNIEQCAFAAWTHEEWARHPGMLELRQGPLGRGLDDREGRIAGCHLSYSTAIRTSTRTIGSDRRDR